MSAESENPINNSVRERVEGIFEQWGHIAYRHAWIIIVVLLIAMGGLFTQMSKIVIDASTENFLKKDDPVRVRYDEFRSQFGRDDRIAVALETDNIFDVEFLKMVKALHEDIEKNVPRLVLVDSLIDARDTRGVGDELVVSGFLEDYPDLNISDEQMAALRKRALANPVYKGAYLSDTEQITIISVKTEVYADEDEFGDVDMEGDFSDGFNDKKLLTTADKNLVHISEATGRPFLSPEQNAEIVDAISAAVARHERPGVNIHVVGAQQATNEIMKIMREDLSKFTALAVLIIAILLAFLFKRVIVVVLPLTVALLSLLTTLSIMASVGMPITQPIQIIPSFLIAVGVGNSVHLFTSFFQCINKGDNKEDALAHALRHSGLAILMTGLTTAGGLVSFTSSELTQIVDFGTITPIGVLSALFLSLVLLPALIAVFPIKAIKNERANDSWLRNILVACGDMATDHAKKVVTAWSTLLIISLYFTFQISFSHDTMKWLPKDHKTVKAVEVINKKLNGGMTFEILLDTGKENGVKDPEFLNKIDEIYQYVDELKTQDGLTVKKAMSIIDVSKELNQALHGNDPKYYTIPQDKNLVAQELLLFENSGADDLERMVDGSFQKARVGMMIDNIDAIKYPPLRDSVLNKVYEIMGEDVEVLPTGLMDLMLKVLHDIVFSMSKSYIVAFMVITPLMVILIGSVKLGLMSMIPNLSPIIITLGIMGIFQIPMDSFTLLIGSIALGLAVDDTIHFMHNFQRFHARSKNVKLAVRQTLETTGQALFFTSVVLSIAFLIFIFSSMENFRYFGILTGICIMMAFLSDVIFAPALVKLFVKK